MGNQRTLWQAIVTIVMWVALTAISIVFMFLDDVTSIGAAIFLVIMAGMAMGGTISIWSSSDETSTTAHSAASSAAAHSARKSKRAMSPDLARLVDQLDENQIVELETLLLSRDEDFEEYA